MQKINARVSLYYKCFNCICVITIMIIIMTMILILILILNGLILNSLSILMMILILILTRVTLRFRIANRLVMDSRCRGGIVHSRCGFSRALLERRNSPTALWRFRASTSNSLIGRSRPHADTSIRHIYHICAR